jgi:hypothetical protein
LFAEGHVNDYRPLTDLHLVQSDGSSVVGLLVMQNERLRAVHVAVIDEAGVIDPSDGFPDHIPWSCYPSVKRSQGFVLKSEFLAVQM